VIAIPLLLALELPPLAFGPALELSPFRPPRELTCSMEALMSPAAHVWPSPRGVRTSVIDPRSLRPVEPGHLIGRGADTLLALALVIGTRATWDNTPPANRGWLASGAPPVDLPRMAPPVPTAAPK
jgi:hypothetical protein